MFVKISIAEISSLAQKALLSSGINEEDSKIIIAHLLDGELSGHSSHGFFRIPGIVRSAKKAGNSGMPIIEKETAISGLFNGNNRQGLVVALQATEMAIKKAKENKVAIIGGYNFVGTTGAMGYFCRKISEQGLVGFMIAGSAEGVSPWGGAEMILGTNPICISIPKENNPIVVDLATSNWAYGDLALAMLANKKIPEGVVLDKDGNPSTDPNDADNGSQLPFGGHKGYALGLAVEILAGPFVGAKAGVKAVKGSDGFTIMAVSPDIFVDQNVFIAQTTALIDEIKNSKKRPGVNEIFYPGEQSHKRRISNSDAEYIEVLQPVIDNINQLIEG